MALTLDATPGGENSNAYITEAEADALLEEKITFFTTWDAFTSQQKIARIITATRAIDRMPILGVPVNVDQALKFPSTRQLTNPFDPATEIPDEVKRATAEMIMHHYINTDATTGQVEEDISRVAIFQEVDVTFVGKSSGQDSSSQGGNLEAVKAELREWLGSATNFKIEK